MKNLGIFLGEGFWVSGEGIGSSIFVHGISIAPRNEVHNFFAPVRYHCVKSENNKPAVSFGVA